MKALCFYEQIADVRRDQEETRKALEALQDVVTRFPTTPYGRDARLKLDLTRDHLAGKEMDIGRFYLSRRHYLAAVNRFKTVIDVYGNTSHVPEALHRLNEAYTALGLYDQAQKAAAVLGYNYTASDWYKDSYGLAGSAQKRVAKIEPISAITPVPPESSPKSAGTGDNPSADKEKLAAPPSPTDTITPPSPVPAEGSASAKKPWYKFW